MWSEPAQQQQQPPQQQAESSSGPTQPQQSLQQQGQAEIFSGPPTTQQHEVQCEATVEELSDCGGDLWGDKEERTPSKFEVGGGGA